MDSTLLGIIITAVVTFGGAWLGLRGTKATTRTSDLASAAQYWKDAVDRQDKNIAELTEKVDLVSTENRTFRRTLVGVIDRLRREPPPDHRVILDYILDNVPSLKE